MRAVIRAVAVAASLSLDPFAPAPGTLIVIEPRYGAGRPEIAPVGDDVPVMIVGAFGSRVRSRIVQFTVVAFGANSAVR